MCDGRRVFSTSFRYSEKVKKVIEGTQGKTTADKIEYICLDYEKNRNDRENYIKELDKKIREKQKQLDSLSNKICKVKDVSSLLDNLVSSINKCNT